MSGARAVTVGPRDAVAGLFLLFGVVAATLAAGNAAGLGEPPQTVLPFGRAVAAWGLPALGAYRLLASAAVWAVVVRVRPRYGTAALAALGVWWLGWTVWQLWVLLALT